MAFDMNAWLIGEDPKVRQATTQTGEQQQFQNMILQMLQDPTGEGMDWLKQILSGDEGAFKDFEAPYKRQFEQETVPGIAERFAGMGSGGAQDSSGMQQTMAQSGTELSQNLAQLRSGLKMNAMQQLQGMMAVGQQPSFENIYEKRTTGLVPEMAGEAAKGAAKAGAQYFLS